MNEIRNLADGEIITEPGFYAIDLDRHHDQPCDGVSVTSGVLRKMELETPADVWATHKLNPDRWEKPDTDALRLGRAMAAYVEGGMAAVAAHFLILPEDKPRRPSPAQIAAYDKGTASMESRHAVDFWRKVEADGRTPLADAEITMIENMGKVLAADPAAAAVMGGIPEITMAWRDEITGIWVLSRPDTINFDGTVTDYKKCSTQGRPFTHHVVDQNISRFGYDMQLALGAEGLERLGVGWPTSAGIIAQWDQIPHHIILREISDEDLRIGQWRNRRALNRFAECLRTGHWPGPGEDVGAYMRPPTQREELLQAMQEEGVYLP